MIACAFIHKLDLANINDFVGLGRKMPYSCLAFILAALALQFLLFLGLRQPFLDLFRTDASPSASRMVATP
jgi:hypothetical protein